MAICGYCRKEMLTAKGCRFIAVEINGIKHKPIKWGEEDDFEHYGHKKGDRCHDCGAVAPAYHHPGCDMERCPKCKGQLISCGCLDGDAL